MTLYIATSNPGKLRDFSAAAAKSAPTHFEILPLPGLAEIPAPPEDEPTFEGNAHTKAIYYSNLSPGKIILADDSGLEVDSLDGAPGVRSARYAEDAKFGSWPDLSVDERNNRCLLHALRDAPVAARQARYRCVLAAARDGRVLATANGSVSGVILLEPRGNSGFGYDPLFFLPGLEKTMAEIDLQTKLSLSHRGRALRALLPQLS